MKEEMASNPGPSVSQIEPSRKRIKVEEEEDPYYFSDIEVQKAIQFEQVPLLKEEPDEYEKDYEEEIHNECQRKTYKEEEYKDEYEENDYEEEYGEHDFSDSQDMEDLERTEIITQDPGFLGTTGIFYHSSSSLSTNESSMLCPNTSFHWSRRPPPCRPKFSFYGQSDLMKVPSGNEPHDFFNLVFTDELFQLLVQETNAFAEELFRPQDSNPQSHISCWKDTSVDEMKVFIGLLFHMGIIKVNRLEDYWNKNEKFDLKYFQTRMSKNRWLNLQQAFHLARNPVVGDPVPKDPLFKIRPLLEFFHDNMKAVQVPGKNVRIDESMVPWRGRISSRQCISKRNVKFYILTEPDGLLHRFLIYSGSTDKKKLRGLEHARKVVFKLMSGLLGEGRSIYMDNQYTSVDLASDLLNQQTYVTGILCLRRKSNPRAISTVKLKRGEIVQWWSQNGINVTKWKDNKDLLTVSTEFSGDLISISRHRIGLRKPQVVLEYNKNMKGVDRINQSLSYCISPQRGLRWYQKFSFHIFELMLLNCYILYSRSSETRRLDLHDFRLSIVDYLCVQNSSSSLSVITSPMIINRIHFPKASEVPEGKVRRKQRRCRYCSKLNLQTVTTTYCPGCPENPGLCITNCFLSYHQDKGFHLM